MSRYINKPPRRVYEDVALRLESGSHILPGVIIEGVQYESRAAAAATYGVTTMAISHWINGQISEDGIYYPPFENCQPVFINNKHKQAWRRRVENNTNDFREPPGYPPAVVIDGFIYASTEDAASTFGVSVETIRNWCRTDDIANCWYESNKVYDQLVA